MLGQPVRIPDNLLLRHIAVIARPTAPNHRGPLGSSGRQKGHRRAGPAFWCSNPASREPARSRKTPASTRGYPPAVQNRSRAWSGNSTAVSVARIEETVKDAAGDPAKGKIHTLGVLPGQEGRVSRHGSAVAVGDFVSSRPLNGESFSVEQPGMVRCLPTGTWAVRTASGAVHEIFKARRPISRSQVLCG